MEIRGSEHAVKDARKAAEEVFQRAKQIPDKVGSSPGHTFPCFRISWRAAAP